MTKVLDHKFEVMSVKTANKDNQKYLNKQGGQAWRVSVKIGDEWYGNMIWEEDMLPVKGKTYHIELSENDGFKNWAYKLKSKKEQVLEMLDPRPEGGPEGFKDEPPMPYTPPKDDVQERIIKGMAGNQAAAMLQYNENDSPEDIAKLHFQVTIALYELEADWYRN